MKQHKFGLILGIIFIAITGISLYKYFFKSWTPYYQEKLYKEPRPLLIKTVELFKGYHDKEKIALDLGAGAGNSTAFLLKNGWHVWANDVEAGAIKIISSRRDVEPYRKNLVLIHKSFIDLRWEDFPQFNLIYAGYSLPFVNQVDFLNVWKKITNALPSGGLFAGHFFGLDHGAFNWWIKRKMTFFTKEQVLKFFKDFKIELFEEFYQKNDRGILDHSFNVIARKL